MFIEEGKKIMNEWLSAGEIEIETASSLLLYRIFTKILLGSDIIEKIDDVELEKVDGTFHKLNFYDAINLALSEGDSQMFESMNTVMPELIMKI